MNPNDSMESKEQYLINELKREFYEGMETRTRITFDFYI
jgi:hypothetical protein